MDKTDQSQALKLLRAHLQQEDGNYVSEKDIHDNPSILLPYFAYGDSPTELIILNYLCDTAINDPSHLKEQLNQEFRDTLCYLKDITLNQATIASLKVILDTLSQ